MFLLIFAIIMVGILLLYKYKNNLYNKYLNLIIDKLFNRIETKTQTQTQTQPKPKPKPKPKLDPNPNPNLNPSQNFLLTQIQVILWI